MLDTNSGQIAELLGSLASGKLELIDLTTPLHSSTPTIHLPEPFPNSVKFSLEEVAKYDDRGPFWYTNNIHTGEHVGTHLDAPIHWLPGKDGLDVASIPLDRLIGPACVIDVTEYVESDPDFLLQQHHVLDWEAEHGQLPSGSWLILRTGWDRFADDEEAFLNTDEGGSHTPGVSAECARWLAEDRPISGFGAETVGIDAGRSDELEPPMPMHHLLLGHNKYGITSLRNVKLLPPTGAMLIVAPLPIKGGTGSPARVIAVVAKTSTDAD